MGWRQWYMKDEGTPDRRIGLVAGIAGGIVGYFAMRAYCDEIAPMLFPLDANPDKAIIHAEHTMSPIGKQQQYGETPWEAMGRMTYQMMTGDMPDTPDMRSELGETAQLLSAIGAGAVYGGTRTTTRTRDFAGGFFYGIRLWLGETIGLALMGLRADPRAYKRSQHLWRLSAVWVYSFTTTAITRVLYRLLGGPV